MLVVGVLCCMVLRVKALKSALAASILASPEGAKAIRKWLVTKRDSVSIWHNGVQWLMKIVGKAK
jgi:hypothetical protein